MAGQLSQQEQQRQQRQFREWAAFIRANGGGHLLDDIRELRALQQAIQEPQMSPLRRQRLADILTGVEHLVAERDDFGLAQLRSALWDILNR